MGMKDIDGTWVAILFYRYDCMSDSSCLDIGT